MIHFDKNIIYPQYVKYNTEVYKLLRYYPWDELTDEFLSYIIKVASGQETKNEINNYREISIFKDGVTL